MSASIEILDFRSKECVEHALVTLYSFTLLILLCELVLENDVA